MRGAFLGVARGAAGVEERVGQVGEPDVGAGAPLERGRERRAAVQQVGIAVLRVPHGGGLRDALAHAEVVAALVDPVAQPRPRVDQRLVHDLDAAVVDGQEALGRRACR